MTATWVPCGASCSIYPRLLIIPDGLLNSLPFAALYDNQSGHYLAQSHELLVAPSLTTWMLLVRREVPAAGPPLVVGYSSGSRLRRAVEETRGPSQPHSQRPKSWLKKPQRCADFASAARDASLVHIATHGLYRADTPVQLPGVG